MKNIIFALLAAIIWGTSFVSQSIGAASIPTFAFNAMRGVMAFLFLLILSVAGRRLKKNSSSSCGKEGLKKLFLGGLLCGTMLFFATNLQQAALATVSSGKTGFLTALYIVIVPILGLFLHRKISKGIWIGVVLAVAGMYFLCIKDTFALAAGDLYVIGCAFCFAVHILLLEHFTKELNSVELSCAQFLTVAVLSSICMLLFETPPTLSVLTDNIWILLYTGILSSGVAYTFQTLALKGANPVIISLIMSLESVFSVVAGALILGDTMTPREYLGCALMLAAVVIAQVVGAEKPKHAKKQAA